MKNNIAEKPFKYNAIFNGKHFEHFGIHPVTASIYGHSEEEIVELEMIVSKDQTKPPSNDGNMVADYWGWFDSEREKYTMIYAKWFLLDMCFPAGIKTTEETNQGKAYRLEIIKKNK